MSESVPTIPTIPTISNFLDPSYTSSPYDPARPGYDAGNQSRGPQPSWISGWQQAQSAGGYTQSAGGYAQSAGGYTQSAGGYTQSAGYPQSAGGYPQSAGGYPQSAGGYPQSTALSYASRWPSEPATEREPEMSYNEQEDNIVEAMDVEAMDVEAQTEQEYSMSNDISVGEHYTVPRPESNYSQKQKGKAMNFVGGFVTGLRNLPRAMTRNPVRERKTLKKGQAGGVEVQDPTLPGYTEEGQSYTGPSNVQYVEGVPMPSAQPSSSQPVYAEEERLSDVQLGNRHDTRASHYSGPHTSQFGFPGFNSFELPPPGTVSSPVPVEPLPTADYVKMEERPTFPAQNHSLGAQLAAIWHFLLVLKDLPWFSDRVTVDYYPEQSSRAADPRAKVGCWYSIPGKHQEIDLLATPAQAEKEMQRSDLRYPDRANSAHLTSSHCDTSCSSASRARRSFGSRMSGSRLRSSFMFQGAQMYPTQGSESVAPNTVESGRGESLALFDVPTSRPMVVSGQGQTSQVPTQIYSPPLSANYGDSTFSRA